MNKVSYSRRIETVATVKVKTAFIRKQEVFTDSDSHSDTHRHKVHSLILISNPPSAHTRFIFSSTICSSRSEYVSSRDAVLRSSS